MIPIRRGSLFFGGKGHFKKLKQLMSVCPRIGRGNCLVLSRQGGREGGLMRSPESSDTRGVRISRALLK